MVREIVVNAT
jgi:hypothetical protein